MKYYLRTCKSGTQEAEQKLQEILIKEMLENENHFLDYKHLNIKEYQEKIKELEVKKLTATTEEKNKIAKEIKKYEGYIEHKDKQIKNYIKQKSKIQDIIYDCSKSLRKTRLDGNLFSLGREIYAPIGSFKKYGDFLENKINHNYHYITYVMDLDIEHKLFDVLHLLGEKMPTSINQMIQLRKTENLRKKFNKELKKLIKKHSGFIDVYFEDTHVRLRLKDLYTYISLNLLTYIEERNKPLNYVPENDSIYLSEMDFGIMDSCELYKGYSFENGEKINELQKLFEEKINTKIVTIQKLREHGWNKAVELEKLYKEYAVHYVGAEVLNYLISKLSNDPIHKPIISKLENIVKKHQNISKRLKNKADKEYEKFKKQIKDFDKNFELEESNMDYTKDLVEENTIEENEKVPEEQTTKKEEKRVNVIELKNLSSGYRAKYVEERNKGTELGKLDYSEFLKQWVPEEKELIEYVKTQESLTRNMYHEYIREVVYCRENNYQIPTFKRFVERKYKIEDFYDLEIPLDIEKEIKKGKNL